MNKSRFPILFISILIALIMITPNIEARPNVVVYTNKPEYLIGEEVIIMVLNNGDSPMPQSIIRVFKRNPSVHIASEWTYELSPGETYTYAVPNPGDLTAGEYAVEIRNMLDEDEIWDSTTFRIIASDQNGGDSNAPPPSLTVETTWNEYDVGDTVAITIRYIGDAQQSEVNVYYRIKASDGTPVGSGPGFDLILSAANPVWSADVFTPWTAGDYVVEVWGDAQGIIRYDSASFTVKGEQQTAPARVDVSTDKSEYSLGEQIIVTFHNLGNDPVTVWARVSYISQSYDLVQRCEQLFDLSGGGTGTWSVIPGQNCFGLDTPGTYNVRAQDKDKIMILGETTFSIRASSDGGIGNLPPDGGQQPSDFDFTLGLTPTSTTVKVGDTANYMILITYSNPSYAGTMINIQQPTGLDPTMQFQLAPTGALTITTSPTTPPGTYTFTVTGSAQGKTHQTTGTLIVSTEAPTTTQTPTITTPTQILQLAGDFTILPSPIDISILPGETATFTLTVEKIGDFNDPVTFTGVSGHPADSTPDLQPEDGTPRYTATLKIETPESTQPGTYKITVEAKGADKTHAATLTLTIKENPQETPPTTEAETTTPPTSGTSISDLLSNPINLMIIAIAVLAVAIGATALKRARAPTPAPPRPEPSTGYCRNCGAALKPGATFCRSCGHRNK